MTIKDEYLFLNGKQKPFINNSFHTSENKNQSSNLNLNQSYKCQILSPVHSKSKLLNDKYGGSTVSDTFEEKEKSQASKKPSKISDFTIQNDESNKSWKNKISSNPNNSSSTLSLHIKPYKNSVKAVSFNSFDFLEKRKSETFKENQHFTVSTFNVQNPFEFPRQQSDKASAPELSQFKASQRLLNSNKASGMNPQQPLPTGHLDIRPELRLAHQRQMMQQQQQQQQQGQRPPQPYPPHYPQGGLPEQYPRGNSPMQFQPQQSMMPQSSQMDFQMNQPPHGHMYPQRLPHPAHSGTGYPSQSQYPPSGPQDAAMRQAQMQYMKQQQLQQHQFQQHQQHHQQSQQQQQPPQQIIPPQPPIELQMNEPNPNLPVHLAQIPIQFPGPGPSNELESTVKSEWIEKITRLTPRPLFHPNLLENLSSKSVGFLCGIGKDVIQELVIRMVSITAILKVPNWKTNAFAEVELILSYSKFLIEKIREIRAHVDRKTITNQKLSANDFIELMALPTAPQLPKKVQELRDTYLGNENFLFRVSNAFKKVEWLGENADPRNASLIFKDEIARINAAEDARRQPSNPNPKKP